MKWSATIPFLSSLIRHCLLNIHHLTARWKYADIRPVLKKRKSFSLESYRPITILSTTSKIFERTIQSIIDELCNDNNYSTTEFQFTNRTDEPVELVLFMTIRTRLHDEQNNSVVRLHPCKLLLSFPSLKCTFNNKNSYRPHKIVLMESHKAVLPAIFLPQVTGASWSLLLIAIQLRSSNISIISSFTIRRSTFKNLNKIL